MRLTVSIAALSIAVCLAVVAFAVLATPASPAAPERDRSRPPGYLIAEICNPGGDCRTIRRQVASASPLACILGAQAEIASILRGEEAILNIRCE